MSAMNRTPINAANIDPGVKVVAEHLADAVDAVDTLVGAISGLSAAELAYIDGITPGTQAASKAVVADANVNTGVSKVTALHIGASGSETQVTATAAELNITDGLLVTAAEINRACDVSTRIVDVTTTPLVVTEADHANKTIVLDLATGIAATLPAAAAGLKFRFIVKTTFTGAASIKSVAGTDIMVGYALMGNDTDNTTVRWPAVAGDTADTIDLLGTANSTGGMAGQEIEIEGLAAGLWYVKIVGDAAGTEATPFTNTVA